MRSPTSSSLHRIVAALLAVLVLATGCARGGSAPDATPSPNGTPAGSGTVSPAADPTGGEYTTAGCDEPPDDFELLCEVVELVRTRYVDPPSVTALAAAAADGVENSDETGDGPEPAGGFTCAVPGPDFAPLCDALSQAGGPSDDSIEAAVRAMIREGLDPNSVYMDARQYERTREDQSGQVEGIGALVTTEDRTADDPETTRCPELSATCRLVIVSVFEGAPADQAGLQAGDLIVRVDGEGVEGRTIDEVVEDVRGRAGTDVELGIERDGDVRTVTITRAAVDIPVIERTTVGDTAYLRLTLFTGDSDERFEAALRELLSQRPERLVLDLRMNPGGALDAAVNITSEFLDEGLVLRTRSPEESRDYEVQPGGLATDDGLEVVVVVDRGSASASEVLAAALREAGRATIVGERTFGKDTVQQTFPLDAGGALKLTIARWVTPNGDGFGDGVEPDVTLEVPVDAAPDEVVDLVLGAVD